VECTHDNVLRERHLNQENLMKLPSVAVKRMTGAPSLSYDFSGYNEYCIFNKLSENSTYGYNFFPYGYLFRYPKWGTINSLGFRSGYELSDIKAIRREIFLVEFYGGSTGFDILVSDHETIAARIEKLLNENATELGINRPVVVLNLSQPGNVILNHILNFTLYGYALDPDIIISHGGFNDFLSGMVSDHALLRDHAITYQDTMESWARFLHQSKHTIPLDNADESNKCFMPVDMKSYPPLVVNAYAERLAQFKTYADSVNATFVSGLQSCLYSKQSISAEETKFTKSYQQYYKKPYMAIRSCFDLASEVLTSGDKYGVHIDIHKYFYSLKSMDTHFGDNHHLLPKGTEEAALCYYKGIHKALSQQ